MEMTKEDLADLKEAKQLLENPGIAAKLAGLIGAPIEKGFGLLPAKWSEAVQTATRLALGKSLQVALVTMDDTHQSKSSNLLHKLMVAASGVAGGAFGLAALTVELPISTTVILRSIADIARSEGEQIKDPLVKLACLEVFALGGGSAKGEAADTGYFVVRATLARSVSEAAAYIAEKGLIREGAPTMVRLLSQIAARFSTAVSEKVAAQAIPVVGAAGGALINTIFIDHFQNMARGHFMVRRLERTYDAALVKTTYQEV
jgi:hypothetical protein